MVCVVLSLLFFGCVGIKLSVCGFVLCVFGFGGFVGGGVFGFEVLVLLLLGVIRVVWGLVEDGVFFFGIDVCFVLLGI